MGNASRSSPSTTLRTSRYARDDGRGGLPRFARNDRRGVVDSEMLLLRG